MIPVAQYPGDLKIRNLHNCIFLLKKRKIREAIELLHGEYGMIVTVLNDDNTLFGIVSSGDLTKALLNGHSLDDTLEIVANKSPVKIESKNLNQNSYLTLINQLEKIVGSDTTGKLFRIPVTNDSSNILGLVTMDMLQTFNKDKKQNRLRSCFWW